MRSFSYGTIKCYACCCSKRPFSRWFFYPPTWGLTSYHVNLEAQYNLSAVRVYLREHVLVGI